MNTPEQDRVMHAKQVEELFRGAIDPHANGDPSAAARDIDQIELVQRDVSKGFAANVTKDNDYQRRRDSPR